ncbi:BBT_HP_G0057880.mRNA.1.CDS.1 [Saccharomyces cerevisiae]|nr:BBT_HP_G0057880.mRNA.1.CDS.1 [Saccharomyces cerevisiae]CAI6733518.1 BBT_HP_G0057880.mRNA.1.CDS.1 [Saccharomyces cerevisiae]
MAFERQGKIEKKISYSLFLNGPNVHFGSILFGAVHKTYNTLDSNSRIIITAQSVAILDGNLYGKSVVDIQFPVLLDSGTYSVYLQNL